MNKLLAVHLAVVVEMTDYLTLLKICSKKVNMAN